MTTFVDNALLESFEERCYNTEECHYSSERTDLLTLLLENIKHPIEIINSHVILYGGYKRST